MLLMSYMLREWLSRRPMAMALTQVSRAQILRLHPFDCLALQLTSVMIGTILFGKSSIDEGL